MVVEQWFSLEFPWKGFYQREDKKQESPSLFRPDSGRTARQRREILIVQYIFKHREHENLNKQVSIAHVLKTSQEVQRTQALSAQTPWAGQNLQRKNCCTRPRMGSQQTSFGLKTLSHSRRGPTDLLWSKTCLFLFFLFFFFFFGGGRGKTDLLWSKKVTCLANYILSLSC